MTAREVVEQSTLIKKLVCLGTFRMLYKLGYVERFTISTIWYQYMLDDQNGVMTTNGWQAIQSVEQVEKHLKAVMKERWKIERGRY